MSYLSLSKKEIAYWQLVIVPGDGESVSLWMLFGLYGNQELEMGMFYSRVVNANSLFVKEIKVWALIFFV
jgi:hypothetical protein